MNLEWYYWFFVIGKIIWICYLKGVVMGADFMYKIYFLYHVNETINGAVHVNRDEDMHEK